MTPDNQPALPELVSAALNRAYNLGQEYWQDADSMSINDHHRANDTAKKFQSLIAQTLESLRRAEGAALGEGREKELRDAREARLYNVHAAKALVPALATGHRLIYRDAFRWKDGVSGDVLPNHYDGRDIDGLAEEFSYEVVADLGFAAVIRSATPTAQRVATGDDLVDKLAQEIRRVDGNHSLGAGALAEALVPFIRSLTPPPNGEAVAWVERLARHDIAMIAGEAVGEVLVHDTYRYARLFAGEECDLPEGTKLFTRPAAQSTVDDVASLYERWCDGDARAADAAFDLLRTNTSQHSAGWGSAWAWSTPEGDRVVAAKMMIDGRLDGGATMAALAAYTVPLFPAAQAEWRLNQLVSALKSARQWHLGDKYRIGDDAEQEAWRKQLALYDAALAAPVDVEDKP